MPSASEGQYFYHACHSRMTPDAVRRSILAVQDVAGQNGVDISDEDLEVWVKPGGYLIGVMVNMTAAAVRDHNAAMRWDGWERRV